MGEVREAVHREPVWRHRADFVIASAIDSGNTDVTTEQLWVHQLDEYRFELCCIPFFVYDLALGDAVETDENYMLQRVLSRSGHYTFRISLAGSSVPGDEIAAQLQEMGALIEWSSAKLLAVDAAVPEDAQRVADILEERERKGELIYETGRTA